METQISTCKIFPLPKQIRITANASEQYYPKIYGNTIVWEDLRNGNDENFNYDIYMYDLSTSRETGYRYK